MFSSVYISVALPVREVVEQGICAEKRMTSELSFSRDWVKSVPVNYLTYYTP